MRGKNLPIIISDTWQRVFYNPFQFFLTSFFCLDSMLPETCGWFLGSPCLGIENDYLTIIFTSKPAEGIV
jgi:hypothetical protein